MVQIIFILAIALIPPILTLLMQQRIEAQARSRLQAAIAASERRQLRQLRLPADAQRIDGIGVLIGDFTCRYNARSPHIRCAVNPTGPCENCRFYESNL